MRPLVLLERRLQRSDMVQTFTLAFAVLIFVLISRWPSGAAPANESWFAVAQARAVLLALLGLGFGVSYGDQTGRQRAVTGMAVWCFALLSIPIDLAAYAASFPATPLWWTLLLPLVDTVAFYGIGLLLGRVLRLLRLSALLPVVVPGLIVGLIALDIRLQLNLANPMTSSVAVAPFHLLLMSLVASITVLLLWRDFARDRS